MNFMTSAVDKPCYLFLDSDSSDLVSSHHLMQLLEKGNIEEQIFAMKKLISSLINGGVENLDKLTMNVIRFVLPKSNHTLKKLLLVFWEVIEKHGPDGKLKPEFILVCNALLEDLKHPNEYIRGATLRFLAKLKEPEILESLVQAVRLNLEHRHSFVRRNAVLALFALHKNAGLCPDAPELVHHLLQTESDVSCRRNAFLMLFHCAQEMAIEFLNTSAGEVSAFPEEMQLVVLECVRKLCLINPTQISKYMKIIIPLLSSSSSAVKFEAASSALTLSNTPLVVREATLAYVDILCAAADANAKMIVLDRLLAIKKKHKPVLQQMVLDVLRGLSSPLMEVRKKTLEIAFDLISPQNIDDVISVLKQEISKTKSDSSEEESGSYRQLLIQSIRACAGKFPEVASQVVLVLMDFLTDASVDSSSDVALFVREVCQKYPQMRADVCDKLRDIFPFISIARTLRVCLWIFAEYSATDDECTLASYRTIMDAVGPLPLHQEKEKLPEGEEASANAAPAEKPAGAQSQTTVTISADGTYVTQSAISSAHTPTDTAKNKPSLRTFLMGGDYYLATLLASSLTKLQLRLAHQYKLQAETLLTLTALIRLGESSTVPRKMDAITRRRILLCVRVLTAPDQSHLRTLWLSECIQAYADALAEKSMGEKEQKRAVQVKAQCDKQMDFRLLKNSRDLLLEDMGMGDDDEYEKATGYLDLVADNTRKLSRVYQLSGMSDVIYAEAYVNVHQFDVVLDVLIINQSKETLQNVSLELSTIGDLKVCERPQSYTLGPLASIQIKASIKVSSTETGIIFGNLVYDIAGKPSSDRNSIILSEIRIDIMDYISDKICTDIEFRTMWASFEWENKIAVATNITNITEYLENLLKTTNMKCLTPQSALQGDCGFISANLYAKTIFGEDALANVSVQVGADQTLSGFVRIRSKTQGLALSLGDKITLCQKAVVLKD
eukprot:GCRY01002815.1.p1 GENE.GCRY01002815.1~~GCRY01002815.1.p1  ORF type:complete len:953 (+),score=322.44 GCRY01002815.1:219-3077(+)